MLLVGGDDSSGGEPGKPAPSAWAQEAGRQLTAKPGMRYDGTLTLNGKPVNATLQVTRNGVASGTLTAGALKADLVTAGGVTYVRAGTAFWRDHAGETGRADDYTGRWTKAPASLFGVDVRDLLGPKAIAAALLKAPAKPPAENVAGTPAYRVKTPRADYLVTNAPPYRLLAVQTAGHGDPRFGATEIADPGPLFAAVRPRVASLPGAVDPALRFAPGKLTFVNCNENTSGCTVSVPASLTEPKGSAPAGARAVLRATVTSGAQVLGQCRGSGAVPANGQLVLRCTVVGGAWKRWMKRALDSPGQHAYQASARVLGEAVSAADAARLLKDLDAEGGPRAAARASVPASVPTSARP
ncbi:hypothetical protein [Actinomadura hibisca]|uniref:hypothetical protein n=1 Tax=Actinomadura hibisca TaxID=68565 RepID=UPI0008357435|nr:hypothetical protein [Actinomadura hibisca]